MQSKFLLQAQPPLLASMLQVAQQVRQACEQVGFFYLAGHGVADNLIQQVGEDSR
jgi:isopenicillin N synthase-like dioxygenase